MANVLCENSCNPVPQLPLLLRPSNNYWSAAAVPGTETLATQNRTLARSLVYTVVVFQLYRSLESSRNAETIYGVLLIFPFYITANGKGYQKLNK